jgi:hypothetical protein
MAIILIFRAREGIAPLLQSLEEEAAIIVCPAIYSNYTASGIKVQA